MRKSIKIIQIYQKIIAIIIVILIAAFGIHLLNLGHAQTPFSSTYAANGQLKSPATLTSGGSNNGSQAVTFGTAITTGGSLIPNAPTSLNAPTKLVFDDEFNTGSLNTKEWVADWGSNGATQNNTTMEESNVSVDSNGLELNLASNGTGAIVDTNPSWGGGFQISPNSGGSVYVEWQAKLPGGNGQAYNWPALWLTGQNWPNTGEIDVMEGFGNMEYHTIWGSCDPGGGNGCFNNPGGSGANWTAGPHTFGVLWSESGTTFVYDGKVVGTQAAPVSSSPGITGPMYLVMENSDGSPSSLPTTMTVRYVRVWQ